MSDMNLRVRGASEIVDAAFALYRRHLLQYVMVTAVAYTPFIIVSLFVTTGAPLTNPEEISRVLPVVLLIALLSLFSFALVGGVVAHMGADSYLGAEPDVKRTIQAVVPRIPAMLAATFISGILMFIGALFLLLPAIYVFAIQFAVIPIIVLEKMGPLAALNRSRKLSKGHKLHILGTLALSFGIYLVLSLGISVSVGLLENTIISLMASSLYVVFTYPIVNLAIMVLYYDTRIRVEGFDVEHMSRSLPPSPTLSSMGSSVG